MRENMENVIQDEKVTIIAEIAQSYEGKYDVLTRLVEALCATRIDGIMFQVIYADEIAIPENNNYAFFKSLEFSEEEWKAVIERIHIMKKLAVGEVFGISSAKMLCKAGVDVLKVHPADLANIPFLRAARELGVPLIVGVGGANEEELQIAIDELKQGSCRELVLVHGYQRSPTEVKDSHLLKMNALTRQFGLPVGYSDHVAGSIGDPIEGQNPLSIALPIMAVACGARLIEKHVMLDRSKKWEDYESAITPEELEALAELINSAESAWGSEDITQNDAEEAYRMTSRKYIVANTVLSKGHILQYGDIDFKRIADPRDGIVNSSEVIGKRLLRPVDRDKPITLDDLGE